MSERENAAQLLDLDSVRRQLGLSVYAAYRAARLGDIPAVRVGGAWKVPRPALELFLRGEWVSPRATAAQRARAAQ